MENSMVRSAANAFAKGNYSEALSLYQQLARKLGLHNFKTNISIAEKRLWNTLVRKDYSALSAKTVKVACVMDEFTFHSYEPECQLFPLTPSGAIEELESLNPDLLFIESAWRGKNDLWDRKIGTLSTELKSILHWCKQRKIPTVFWNKEDPIHFDTFLTTAQQFDCVFTTDIDCIARYKQALHHDRVYLLPFACQPKIHNPVELYQRKDSFCFAGAYYVRYPERTRDLGNYVAQLPQFKPLEIFDRNHGKNDANYQFPTEYRPYIVGTLPFHEIDKAYKGYRYAINLNSIKQSQSMFARRVYELLGSNTITVSNFSRGVRLLFGDLVVTSDSGKEIVERLKRMSAEDEQKLRLAGLRKVMLEHTYGHRLAYVLSKALGRHIDASQQPMLVVACAQSNEELNLLVENFRRQRLAAKRLLLVTAAGCLPDQAKALLGDELTLVSSETEARTTIVEAGRLGHWLAPMVSTDYYGPNYLLDLAIATVYSGTDVVGKAAHYCCADGSLRLTNAEKAYCATTQLAQRSSAIRINALPREVLHSSTWLHTLATEHWCLPGMGIDPFNHCRNSQSTSDLQTVINRVDDLVLDTGLACDQLLQMAESITAAVSDTSPYPRWSGKRLHALVQSSNKQINIESNGDGLHISATQTDGKHQYLYSPDDQPLSCFPTSKLMQTYLEVSPGLDVQYVFVFLDEKKRKISHVIHTANKNHTAPVPDGTKYVRFGWRIAGSGACIVKHLQWGHSVLTPAAVIGKANHLVLTNHYPSYDDLYRNGFVHTRVAAYAERGVKVDVFRLRRNENISFHEFQDIDIITGTQTALDTLLTDGKYQSILVHFLDPEMWEVIKKYVEKTKLIVWVHGAEIQPWHRRDYNYSTDEEREAAKIQSHKRMAFWRELLIQAPQNLKLVFVSRYFAEEVMEDLGFRLPDNSYHIIHNPIDTELFDYQPKPVEQRKRILSIRPYASRKYANDLSVSAILKLSKRFDFSQMEFHMIGDGKLFDDTLAPLRGFSNVKIERRFLTHAEIAKLHKDYGIFLTPTRMDAQGVSRDEAMSSGLIPATNAVTAIPEFVDPNCAILAGAEDADDLAQGIADLIENPSKFSALSEAAAKRVRKQSATNLIVFREISLLFENCV